MKSDWPLTRLPVICAVDSLLAVPIIQSMFMPYGELPCRHSLYQSLLINTHTSGYWDMLTQVLKVAQLCWCCTYGKSFLCEICGCEHSAMITCCMISDSRASMGFCFSNSLYTLFSFPVDSIKKTNTSEKSSYLCSAIHIPSIS